MLYFGHVEKFRTDEVVLRMGKIKKYAMLAGTIGATIALCIGIMVTIASISQFGQWLPPPTPELPPVLANPSQRSNIDMSEITPEPSPSITILALSDAPSPTPSDTSTPTITPNVGATFAASLKQTEEARPTNTSTPTPTDIPFPTTAATSTPLPTSPPTLTPTSPGVKSQNSLALAHYFAWFDNNAWNGPCLSAGDKPLNLYNSDDPATIASHVQTARDIGLDGFLLHWFGPGNRTDWNFNTLLEVSRGTDFHSTIVFSHHFFGQPSQQSVIDALNYIKNNYSSDPNFLIVDDKPVLFFVEMPRVPVVSGQTPDQAWAAIRNQVDPMRQMIWIAEGLPRDRAPYLTTFDGLYVFKITHAAYPYDYQKSSRWATETRNIRQDILWLGTISPGWDDTRTEIYAAECEDLRIPNEVHGVDRGQGSFYRATFDSVMAGNPDWLVLVSFNGWIEGHYIEPGQLYGDQYLQLTKEFIQSFKSGR